LIGVPGGTNKRIELDAVCADSTVSVGFAGSDGRVFRTCPQAPITTNSTTKTDEHIRDCIFMAVLTRLAETPMIALWNGMPLNLHHGYGSRAGK
jgi:hypothetical protein